MARIARREAESFDPQRIIRRDAPAVYWTGSVFAPCRITGWCRHYGEWFVRLRTRRDAWRDDESWYCYVPGRLIPVQVHPRDLAGWLPKFG